MKTQIAIQAALGLFLSAAIFISCDSQRVYDTFKRIPDSGWHADSLQRFSFDISDISINHNIYFNIRNDRNYGFSNLWLFVKIIPPEGELITDTMQVVLANPAGKWLGKGFSGVYTSQIPYRERVYFPAQGTYTIQVQHGMRSVFLEGITDIGVRVERTKR